MPLLADLPHFALSEFRHPELVEQEAADFLESVRTLYGASLTLTSDARTREENAAAGGSPTSWHMRGRAFDVRAPADSAGWWRLVWAVQASCDFWHRTKDTVASVELELCPSTSGQPHIHFALKNDGSPNVLLFG